MLDTVNQFGVSLMGPTLWLVVWSLIKLLIGLRVSEEEEYEGVDIAECGMEAYPEFTRK